MNAYGLAEQLMTALATLENSAIMLRQQADRITELEKLLLQFQNASIDLAKQIKKCEESPICTKKCEDVQKSEPVAELFMNDFGGIGTSAQRLEVRWLTENYPPVGTKLYTTPHHASYVKQTKPLSDEEIEELQAEHTEKGHFADTLNVKEFARAILKKASEK